MNGDVPYRGDRLSRLRDELFEIFEEINAMPRQQAGRHDENRAWDMSQLWAAYRAIEDCDDFGGYYPRGK